MPDYEYLILGAGAIGSIIGAHLARAGHSVGMLVRERRAAQLREAGLRIGGLIEFSSAVDVITDASKVRCADVLIVAMKTPGTADALDALRHLDVGVALSIQNGLWKNEVLTEVFGKQRVLGALANTSGELLPSGEVLFTRNVNTFIGELSGGLSPRAQRIAGAIDASGVRSTAVADILEREWTKFVGWVGMMVLSVTTGAASWRYLSDPHCASVLASLVRELETLAHASGVRMQDEASLVPHKLILEGSHAEAVAAIIAHGQSYLRDAPMHRMSALQDLEAGRPLEIEETLGHAVRQAARLGLSLPLLDTYYHLTSGISAMRSG